MRIALLVVLFAVVSGCGGTAQGGLDSVAGIRVLVESETDIRCSNWYVTDGLGLSIAFRFTEAADCDGRILFTSIKVQRMSRMQ